MVKGYFLAKDICERFKCSRRTLGRWMVRKSKPFPQPRIMQQGGGHRWAIDDVEAWEQELNQAGA